MAKIGIDARLYYETGVGRYIRNLIAHLQIIDKKNSYVVFLPEGAYSKTEFSNDLWEKREATIPWHSILEQTSFISILLKEKLDLVHFPYFSYPVLYPGKFVVTIHDLIIHHFDTGRATTHSKLHYKLRRLGYHMHMNVGLHRAAGVIAVSRATKNELMEHFGLDNNKISVIYEGVDQKLVDVNSKATREFNDPYFLYVGNAYPHKNLEMVVDAFAQFCKTTDDSKVTLCLVGKKDYFYTRLENYAKNAGVYDSIRFFGNANDEDLQNLYSHAMALVAPSKMEGFGLPVLEAMANNCTVLASDIAVFRELFGDCVQYFDPEGESALVALFTKAMTRPVKWRHDKEKAKKRASEFSWEKTAKKTLEVYNDSLPA